MDCVILISNYKIKLIDYKNLWEILYNSIKFFNHKYITQGSKWPKCFIEEVKGHYLIVN